MNNIIDPKAVYEPFNGMSLDQLRENVKEILMNGITLKCDNDNDVVLRTDTLVKRGSFKDIYLLDILSIANKVYDSRGYILKVRFTNNTPEYWNNENTIIPNQGVIPMIMSEGKRYSMIDGELKKYFATVLPTKLNVLLITKEYIVDFIIQEKMTLSLDFIRKHYQLPVDVIHYIMHSLLEIAVAMNSKGYTFTNFSPTAVMMNFSDNKVVFKLVNTSFIQRGDMVPVNGKMKLYSTASIKQLTNQPDDPMKTMIINILYTCLDIYSPLSLAQKINKTCCNDSGDYNCVVKHLIDSRNKQIEYYSSTDNVFGDIIQIVKDNDDASVIIDKLMNVTSVDDSVVSKLINIIYDAISSSVTFEQPTLDYANSDAYVPTCDMNETTSNSSFFSSRVSKGNNMSTKPSIIRSTRSNMSEDEPVSLKPIFSTSKPSRSNSIFDEDEPVSLKPLFSTSKPSRSNSIFDEDEPVSLKPIFSTSSSKPSVKSSYTVGNLFDDNSASYTTKSNSFASSKPKPTRGSLFEEDESMSLKPIFSTSSSKPDSIYSLMSSNLPASKPDSIYSLMSSNLPASKPTSVMYNSTSASDKCEYLNNRIDNLQSEMNRKLDEIINRLSN